MNAHSKILKDKVEPLFHILLIVAVLFSSVHQAFGQEKVNVSAGFGLPELLNIGVRYQSNQTQIGLSIGSMPLGSSRNIISILGDVYYHFGGFSKLSNRRPLYGRFGLNYLRDETESRIDKYLYLNMRLGRDFNLSKKVGIGIDAGALFELYHQEIRKKPSSSWLNIDFGFPVIPSLGVGLFYKI